MKVFRVGGCVRDTILGIQPKDIDYVVVGSTQQEMESKGFKQVGASFPVFLHPQTGEEYALARTEVSTGSGYLDFSVEFGPEITLEQDLHRRDFTINSIAMDENGNIFDPYNGVQDIKDGVIRMTHHNTFQEDPVRVFRLARFATRYGFDIDQDTITACVNTVMPEDKTTFYRARIEMEKALMEKVPAKFFWTLYKMGQTNHFKEIFDLMFVPQPVLHHAEGDAFVHTMMVLNLAAEANEPYHVRLGALLHDLGKAATPAHILPSHHAHEMNGVPLVEQFAQRLQMKNSEKNFCKAVTEFHTHVHRWAEMKNTTKAKLYLKMKNVDVRDFSVVSFYDSQGRVPQSQNYTNHEKMVHDFSKMSRVTLRGWPNLDSMSVEAKKNLQLRLLSQSMK